MAPKKCKGVNLNFLTILDHYITNLVQKNKINLKKNKSDFSHGLNLQHVGEKYRPTRERQSGP